VTDKESAHKAAKELQNGNTGQYSFEGKLKRSDGFNERFVLQECVSSYVDIHEIGTGFVGVWNLFAALFEDELNQYNRS